MGLSCKLWFTIWYSAWIQHLKLSPFLIFWPSDGRDKIGQCLYVMHHLHGFKNSTLLNQPQKKVISMRCEDYTLHYVWLGKKKFENDIKPRICWTKRKWETFHLIVPRFHFPVLFHPLSNSSISLSLTGLPLTFQFLAKTHLHVIFLLLRI